MSKVQLDLEDIISEMEDVFDEEKNREVPRESVKNIVKCISTFDKLLDKTDGEEISLHLYRMSGETAIQIQLQQEDGNDLEYNMILIPKRRNQVLEKAFAPYQIVEKLEMILEKIIKKANEQEESQETSKG